MSRTTDGDREVVGWSLLLTARILRVLHLAHTVPPSLAYFRFSPRAGILLGCHGPPNNTGIRCI